MAYNKVILNNETLIDLTSDTTADDKVLSGIAYHKPDGTASTGTIPTYDGGAITQNGEVATAGKYFDSNLSVQVPTSGLNINGTILNKEIASISTDVLAGDFITNTPLTSTDMTTAVGSNMRNFCLDLQDGRSVLITGDNANNIKASVVTVSKDSVVVGAFTQIESYYANCRYYANSPIEYSPNKIVVIGYNSNSIKYYLLEVNADNTITVNSSVLSSKITGLNYSNNAILVDLGDSLSVVYMANSYMTYLKFSIDSSTNTILEQDPLVISSAISKPTIVIKQNNRILICTGNNLWLCGYSDGVITLIKNANIGGVIANRCPKYNYIKLEDNKYLFCSYSSNVSATLIINLVDITGDNIVKTQVFSNIRYYNQSGYNDETTMIKIDDNTIFVTGFMINSYTPKTFLITKNSLGQYVADGEIPTSINSSNGSQTYMFYAKILNNKTLIRGVSYYTGTTLIFQKFDNINTISALTSGVEIKGVAKTSGSAGNTIEVYVPDV